MAYIGKEPADSFISFAKQDFSTSATTSYTLDNAVTNENELALFINFVRQEPTTAYTASGTTLTLTSATASGDDMYCVYLGQAKQTVNAPDGSVGNSQVASTIITGQTAETSIATDDTVLIHDTSAGALRKMTRANFVSGVGGNNTPAFHAYANTDQNNNSDNTWTKLQMNAEFFDTDSKYDHSSNYRFTPTVAGKYFFGANVYIDGNDDRDSVQIAFYKNGSNVFYNDENANSNTVAKITAIIDLDADDYVELYAKADVLNNSVWAMNMDGTTSNNRAHWFGYKLIGV